VFVDPNDGQALKDELFELIENSSHREVMSRRARERALDFTSDRMAQNYFNAYVELLDTKANQEQEKFAQCA
jgi:glycosyltransferase involved in cell wall biosynthesis